MGDLTKGQILGALPKLTRADLVAVHATAQMLLGGPTAAPQPGAGLIGQNIFDALVAALGLSLRFENLPPSIANKFRNTVPGLIKFLDTQFKGWDRHQITQQAFTRMLWGLLADDLKARKVPPGIGVMVFNMARIPEVFDDAFPDYLSSGLGPMILRQYARKD